MARIKVRYTLSPDICTGALISFGRQVEHVIRTKNCTHALEIVELFCDLLLARHMLLESEEYVM